MVKLEEPNGRKKDLYDLCLPLRQFGFMTEKMAGAIKVPFSRRGAALPEEIAAFT